MPYFRFPPFSFKGRLLVGFLLSGALFLALLNLPSFRDSETYQWGVTFSPAQAESFGYDWKNVYEALLDDLELRKLRLSAYWNVIEPVKGEFHFDDLDYQLDEAEKRGAKVTLALGRKLPRWPECHEPDWLKGARREQLEQATLSYIGAVVSRYKDHPAIERWQVENEVLFPFGECPKTFGIETLKKEVALVRSMDRRPVMITDSGEWTLWVPLAWYGDVLGSSLYREAYNERFGMIPFPIQPGYYQIRALVWRLLGREVVISELQTEPWGKKAIQHMDVGEASVALPLQKFQRNINFAQRVGFSEVYLWGVEWWYAMKERGNDTYWNEIKNIVQKSVSTDCCGEE